MPEMNGFQFVNHYLEAFNKPTVATKIYILSSSNNPEDKREALNYHSIDSYLLKPMSFETANLIFFHDALCVLIVAPG